MNRFALFTCVLAAAVLQTSVFALPLRNGEQLRYRVSWAVVPGAGEIKIEAENSTTRPGHLLVTSTTSTRKLARMLLPFEAKAESLFNLRTGELVSLHEKAMIRAKPTDRTITFDYNQREATYAKLIPAEPPRTLPLPPGQPVDLIMGLLQTRTWNLSPGEKRDALVLFDDDFYELTIYALRHESVRTPIGTFNALVLEPRMEKTELKGMFKRGSTVKVWIAQDAHRLPVQFQVEFKIGTGTALLEHYHAPTQTSASAAASSDGARASSSDANAKRSRP